MTSTTKNFPFKRLAHPPQKGAGWFIAIGIIMIVVSAVMITKLALASMVATLYIGFMMMAGGALQIIHALALRRWSSPMLRALSGLLYLLAGILVWLRPTFAMSILTFALAVILLATGFIRFVDALAIRPRGWRWLVVSALSTMAVGLVISLGWPTDMAWVMGLFLSVDFLVQGWAFLIIGFVLRSG